MNSIKQLTVLLLLFMCNLSLFAHIDEKKASLSFSGITLFDALKEIEKSFEYTFFYDSSDIDLKQKVSLNVTNQPLEALLSQLLGPINIDYKISNSQIALFPRGKPVSSVSQQIKEKIRIKGVVLDSQEVPIIGASIKVTGEAIGAVTDINGTYELDVPKGSTIEISYIGYIPQKVKAADNLFIKLIEDAQVLNEVVVIAFGTQKRINLTASVATVDSKQLENRPVQNVSQALQGISPGLNIGAPNMGGALGATPTIDIRGSGTIGQGSSSSPLILIDGIEGDMNLINPQDIENISILKDAGASAVYGSRAAFGVILITTKKGKVGKTTINYNNSLRWSTPTNLPSFVDGYSFAKYFNEASANGGLGNIYSETMLENTKLYMEGKLPNATEYDANGVWKTNMESWANTEWFGVYYKDWAFSQEHNLSIRGGTDRATYYISGNFLNMGTDQNYGNENYKRYTLNSKINIKAYEWLDVNLNTKFSRKNYKAPYYQTNSVYYHSMPRRKPSVPIKTPDGVYAKESQLNELENGGDYTNDSDLLYQQIQFVIKPMTNLEIFAEGNFRLNRIDDHSEVLLLLERKEDGSYFAMARDDGYGGRSFVNESMYKTNYYNSNLYGRYNFSIEDKHNFIVTAGFQSELNKSKSLIAQRDDLISQSVPTLNKTTSFKTFGIDNEQYEWATVGFFGRINYDYKSRYLLEVNYRYDGASRFLSDKRWNSFPSVSGAWNIAREPFMESYQSLLGNLKIRASYGRLGNQSVESAYPFYTQIPVGTANGNWLVGGVKPNTAEPEKVVNPLLGWEKVESVGVGLDIGLFNNRLNGNFDYFWRTTKDMIAKGEELPNTVGYNYEKETGTSSAAMINNARMRTTGWEVSLSWKDTFRNGLSYGATLVLSDAQTKVLEFPNPTNTINTYYKGMKIGEIWGYETLGLAKTDEQMQQHLASLPNGAQSAISNIGWTAGDVMYKDLNNDGKIDTGKGVLDDTGDYKIIGNNTPRYNFGVTLYGAYKNFDFSVFFQGTMKRDFWLNGLYFWGATGGYWQSTALKETMNYFRPADTDSYFGPNPNGYLPRPLYNSSQNQQVSSQYLQNIAYMRLKNIQLGYTFPSKIMNRARINNLRVFVSADNVFTVSGLKADAFDPEVLNGHMSGHGKASPLKTTISFGVSVTL